MRLIDLHVDWLLQYTPEAITFPPDLYDGVEGRVGQLAGYLQTTRAAVLACYRRADDWAGQADPWAALGSLIARVEAEFPGRILIGPDDFDRWQDDRDGLTWGLIGVEGFDALVRSPGDLDRLPTLFERGVRVFQPLYGSTNGLGGSSAPGDDRGLTDLGRRFLDAVDGLAGSAERGRPLVDLAHMNPSTMAETLDWYEADPTRLGRSFPVYSHGSLVHPSFDAPRAITLENLGRLRALGGHVGLGVTPPFVQAPAQLVELVERVASLPFEGRVGPEGISIGTDFVGVEQTLPGLNDAEQVVSWFQAHFDRSIAKDLIHDNALALIEKVTGATRRSRPTADLAG